MGQKFSDRDLIESIIASCYIIDYGFIKVVNDNGTVDVTHAKQLKALNGQSLKATVTPGVEMLTIAGAGFSLKFDYKKGDKVLLLGLKDYVPKVEDVTSATETTVYKHYARENLKALPLCVFNDDAKVKLGVEDGTLTIECESDVNVKGENVNVECTKAVVKADNIEANCSSFKVNSKDGNTTALEVTP